MKERKNAEQAYADAMRKMSMPARLDTDKQVISSGSGKIRMKSRFLAYTAAAAVLAVCVAVGAIVIHNKISDDNIKTSTSSNYKLEDDQTIPSGEIKSVEQAIEEHQKCLLLENDEYIKLETNKDNITKEMAESYFNRVDKLGKRDSECMDYLAEKSKSETAMAISARLYDDGNAEIVYLNGLGSEEWFESVTENGEGYLCDKKTGNRIVKLSVSQYDYYDKSNRVFGLDLKLDKPSVDELKSDLSLVFVDKENDKLTQLVIEDIRFSDKVFINKTEKAELSKLAAKAMGTQDSPNYENSVNITADKVVCSQHGMYMRLTLTAANDTGKSLIKKHIETKDVKNSDPVIFLSGGRDNSTPEPDVNLGKSVTAAGWQAEASEITAEKIIYDCYLPLTSAVDMDFGMTIYANMQDPTLTADEISNGEWRGHTLGSIKVKYEKPMKERAFTCGSKKILLSDLCMTFSETKADVTDVTLKMEDGTEEKLTKDDFSRNSIMRSTVNNGAATLYDEMHEEFMQSEDITDDVRACFITKSVDTSKVTSIVYAGEEYKTESEKIKSIDEARKLYSRSYEAQNKIIERYRTEADKHENDKQEFCTGLWNEYDELEKKINEASRYIGLYSDSCIWVNKTTAGTMQFTLWYNKKTIMSRYAKVVISLDKEGKNIVAEGAPTVDFAGFQGDFDGYRGLPVKLNGDLNVIKKDQLYYVTFTVDGRQMTRSFTVTADKPEMTSLERSSVLSDINLEARGKKPVSS